jgi:hypothetical protein
MNQIIESYGKYIINGFGYNTIYCSGFGNGNGTGVGYGFGDGLGDGMGRGSALGVNGYINTIGMGELNTRGYRNKTI